MSEQSEGGQSYEEKAEEVKQAPGEGAGQDSPDEDEAAETENADK